MQAEKHTLVNISAMLRLLHEKGLKQKEIAVIAGVSAPAVYKWEHGGKITLVPLRRLASYLGVTVEDLMVQTFGDSRYGDVMGELSGGTVLARENSSPRETRGEVVFTCENNSASSGVREPVEEYAGADRLAAVERRLGTIERLLLRLLDEQHESEVKG